ncbi:MAG: DegT/DnrJ/EryC1/StrS family aminotransferase [Kiritimatiellae bacterium]|nr:DegT/DnrJ/EryC1/StrS family aminotransferase [Kiritimatiellia bacterium]
MTRLFLSPPHLSGRERELVAEVFASNYIAPVGPMVERFEREFGARLGIPAALATGSGTAALHLALRWFGVGPGDTVVCSTLTFIASIAPAVQLGATPVFVDADEATWCMDADLLAEALKTRAAIGKLPKAVVAVDLYGQCCDYDRLLAACTPYNVPLIADAAESLGATYKGQAAGRPAAAAIYSFNGNKIVTTSGGGMLVSRDGAMVAKARFWATQARDPAPHYQHSEVGYNYRLSNVLAAIGCGQLEQLEQKVAAKRSIFEQYRNALDGLPGVTFMPEAEYGQSNRWLTVAQFDPAGTRARPEQVRLELEARNIEARPVWKPMHLQPVFRSAPVYGGAVAERIFDRGLCLPSGTAMSRADVERVAAIVRQCVGRKR